MRERRHTSYRHYDAIGDFGFRVGLPGKSGLGGGILTVVPGGGSIAAWLSGLNANGNSQPWRLSDWWHLRGGRFSITERLAYEMRPIKRDTLRDRRGLRPKARSDRFPSECEGQLSTFADV